MYVYMGDTRGDLDLGENRPEIQEAWFALQTPDLILVANKGCSKFSIWTAQGTADGAAY